MRSPLRECTLRSAEVYTTCSEMKTCMQAAWQASHVVAWAVLQAAESGTRILVLLIIHSWHHLAALQADIAEVQALCFQLPPQLFEAGEAARPAAGVIPIRCRVPEAAQLPALHSQPMLYWPPTQASRSKPAVCVNGLCLPGVLEVPLVVEEGIHRRQIPELAVLCTRLRTHELFSLV